MQAMYALAAHAPLGGKGLEHEDGIASSLRSRCPGAVTRGCQDRAQAMDLVGPALAAGAVQAVGQNAVKPLGWRGRRDVAVPNQCVCAGHEWLASAGQAGGSGVQEYRELHRHRLPAHVQVGPLANESV
jgi:hypothetical protein